VSRIRLAAIAALALAVSTGLIVATPSDAASKPRAGATCAKKGQKVVHKNVRYTCITSKKRLVWSKGVPITRPTAGATPAPAGSPTPSSSPTRVPTVRFVVGVDCGVGLAPCPEVTTEESAPADQCKIRDPSQGMGGGGGGFPRPEFAKNGVAKPRVLLIPVSFTDLQFTNPALQLADEIALTREFYTRSSSGRTDVQFVVPAPTFHISIDANFEAYKQRFREDLDSVTLAIFDQVTIPDVTSYDSIILTTPRSKTITWGGGGNAKNTKYGPIHGMYLYIGGDQGWALPHILGHTLYALPDLYISGAAIESKAQIPADLLFYDIMANGYSNDYVAWNRWLNGWIEDTEVHCLFPDAGPSTRYLRFLDSLDPGKKLIAIPQGSGKILLAEYRAASSDGYCCERMDSNGTGLLIYLFDTTVRQGFGQMRMFDPPNLLVNGQTGTFEGWSFTVVAADQGGLYVRVIKA
jgi:hypothetical protein